MIVSITYDKIPTNKYKRHMLYIYTQAHICIYTWMRVFINNEGNGYYVGK